MATATRAVLSVAAALLVLFTAATLLSQAYRNARHERGQSHFLKGKRLAAAGRNAEAVDEYRAALAFEHDDPEYRLALALALMNLGRWQEAGTHLTELREADPSNAVINLMLARIAARERRVSDAEAWYHRAIYGLWPAASTDARTQARFELVEFLAHNGQRKQVMAELLALAADAPDDVDTRKRIAGMLFDYGAPDHAADIYRDLAGEDPRDAAVWAGLGEAEFAQDHFREAQAAFRRAVRLNPNDHNTVRRLAETSQIAALDPTLVRLTAAERYGRARELLARTLNSLERCSREPATAGSAAEGARKLLASRRRRDGDTLQAITAAQQLWAERESACEGLPETDQALAAVMTRLGR